MDTLTNYQTNFGPVKPQPLRGRYLQRTLKERDAPFTGADLYRGSKILVEPSLAQAAFIVGCDVNAVWRALQRLNFRKEVIDGTMPLAVPPPAKPKSLPPVPVVYDDAQVLNFVRAVGIQRVLDAACADLLSLRQAAASTVRGSRPCRVVHDRAGASQSAACRASQDVSQAV